MEGTSVHYALHHYLLMLFRITSICTCTLALHTDVLPQAHTHAHAHTHTHKYTHTHTHIVYTHTFTHSDILCDYKKINIGQFLPMKLSLLSFYC